VGGIYFENFLPFGYRLFISALFVKFRGFVEMRAGFRLQVLKNIKGTFFLFY